MTAHMHCVIVDAFSTGRYLPAALARRGVGCTHVQSSEAVPGFYLRTFPSGAFAPEDALVHRGDLDGLVAELARRGPAFVVAGAETGVDLADALAHRLGVPGNAVDAGRVRRDKYEMAMAVRGHGLRAPDTLRTHRFEAARAWAEAYDRWPLVVKPADSAGTDNVFFCSNTVEMCTAFSRILGSSNLMGAANRTVVVQEFLAGTEYFANSVSVDGRHHIAEIWRYHKRPGRGGAAVYDYEEPLSDDDPAARLIRPYLLGVLDALGVRHGPAHSEIMLTGHGPVLVECGARLAGSILPDVVDRCFGTNHVDLTAEALSDPAGFRTWADRPAELKTHLRYVSLISPVSGRVTSLSGFGRIRELESFAGLQLGVGVGDVLAPTVDSATSPGVCYLLHDDPGQIEADYRALRAAELDGLYAVQ
ncbi:ATP-grasp domain-containing protein [Streptoverticillium reticulum]|uniref:ATP-grasp domain-containing protein n=1 Tax=Streptoverticillium reticulum TaxID=1433415 RepID=UPI0039BF29B5